MIQFLVQNGATGLIEDTNHCDFNGKYRRNENQTCFSADVRFASEGKLGDPFDRIEYDTDGYQPPFLFGKKEVPGDVQNTRFWTSSIADAKHYHEGKRIWAGMQLSNGAPVDLMDAYASALCVRKGAAPPSPRDEALTISGFTLDRSNPKLAKAFRDREGRAWGFLPEVNYWDLHGNQNDEKVDHYDRKLTAYENAKLRCERAGAQMPSQAELENLVVQWPGLKSGGMARIFPDDRFLGTCEYKVAVWVLDPDNNEGYSMNTKVFNPCRGTFSKEHQEMFTPFCMMEKK